MSIPCSCMCFLHAAGLGVCDSSPHARLLPANAYKQETAELCVVARVQGVVVRQAAVRKQWKTVRKREN